MLWAGENDFGFSAFDDLAGVHDGDFVGAFRDDAEIVGDEQHGHAEPSLELADQLEDLRLDRHVERRGRLIRDQELGRAGERHGNHDALTLADGELVRIIPDAFLRIGDLDQPQHLDRTIARLAAACPLMETHGFRNLVADGHDRVQRGHRLLKDHRDLVAADAADLMLREARQIPRLKLNFATDDAAGALGQKLHDRERGHALAAAGLADQTDRLAVVDVEAYAVNRPHFAVAREERRAQVADPEERRHSGSVAWRRKGSQPCDGAREHRPRCMNSSTGTQAGTEAPRCVPPTATTFALMHRNALFFGLWKRRNMC